ncbi:MAG TPA: DUF4214 domain-containing protein [Bryobacteraceae bacterium]|nr:DUF4214 domain-containing protein [Bryobacteraceae bacterium]
MAQPAGSPAGAGPTRVLPFRVTDAEYSLALDRIVAVSPSPDTLSIYDPLTLIRTVVALPRPPTALTLSIDGLSAAVGHDGLISIVNLQTAVVEKTVAVSIKVFDLALAPNGWVHASASGGWGTAVSMNTATGAETKVDLLYRGEYFRIHPHGGALYSAEGGGTTARWGIEDGPLRFEWQKSDPPLCGPMWFLADARLVGRCRNVLRTASTSNDDLKYAGKLSGSTGGIVAATHSPERRTLAAVATVDLWSLEATEVTLHDDEFLALTGRITLPNFPVPGQTISSNGKHLFWSKDGARLYAVMQAESGALLNDYALHIISPEYNASTCTFTLSAASAQASASGLNGSIAVTSAASCVWQAKSNAAWITLNTGQFGAGPGTVNFAVGPNLTASSRSGTITAGGQTFTVTQAAGDASTFCSGNISNPTLIAGAKGGSGTLDLTIGPNCSWTASAGSSWSHVLPISGSGSSSFGYTIYPNFGTKPRSTTLTIAGRTVTITQAAGTGAPDERFIGLMYFNFLGRLATPSEVAFHVKHLQSHGKREQAVLAFWNAEEFALGGRFVAGLYVGLLGRDAEFEGWLFNRNAVVGGIVSQAMLAPAFLNSPEFAAKHGLLDNGAFVRMLYRQALNREAQDWEVQQHSETLRKGMKRDVMAQNFLNSAEFRLGVDKRLTSFLLYSTLLLRSIHPQEMAARVSQLEQGVTIGQMVAGILVSNEFTRLLE